MKLFEKLQSRLELYRLEQKYAQRKNRTTFVSNGVQYVNGEYVYCNNTGDSSSTSNSSSAASSPASEFASSSRNTMVIQRRHLRIGNHGFEVEFDEGATGTPIENHVVRPRKCCPSVRYTAPYMSRYTTADDPPCLMAEVGAYHDRSFSHPETPVVLRHIKSHCPSQHYNLIYNEIETHPNLP